MHKLNDSLGGYKLTTKDGKIAYYKASAGADSAIPFSSGSNANLKTMFLDYRRTNVSKGQTATYSIDVSSKISCYKKLTINNFWFQYVNTGGGLSLVGNLYQSGSTSNHSQNSITNIGSYDAETGTLQIAYDGRYVSSAANFEISVIAVYVEE